MRGFRYLKSVSPTLSSMNSVSTEAHFFSLALLYSIPHRPEHREVWIVLHYTHPNGCPSPKAYHPVIWKWGFWETPHVKKQPSRAGCWREMKSHAAWYCVRTSPGKTQTRTAHVLYGGSGWVRQPPLGAPALMGEHSQNEQPWETRLRRKNTSSWPSWDSQKSMDVTHGLNRDDVGGSWEGAWTVTQEYREIIVRVADGQR